MNFTLQPFAKETLTGPQKAWSSWDNIHTFCFMKMSDYRQTIDITCKDTEHLVGLHIEMQTKTMCKDKACLLMRQTKVQISSKALQALKE